MFARLVRTVMPPRYRWWHAAALGVAANAVGVLPTIRRRTDDYYERLEKPRVSPPSWAFGPAWAFNNVTTLWSNLRVANLPAGTPGRRAALALEGGMWGVFCTFTPVFFGLRSPVLGAVDTVAGLGLTAASVVVTARLDRKAAWALVPRLAWLGLAAYVAVRVALDNPDELLDGERRRYSRSDTPATTCRPAAGS